MAEPAPDVERTAPAPWHRRAVDAEAEEGLLLAERAVRIRLKNRIIVDTVAADAVPDPEAWAEEARVVLGRLRAESETSARRMDREREAAERATGRARHQHDYRARDASNLGRRREVYGLVADRLRSWEGDRSRIAGLLASARSDAAEELDVAIRASLLEDGTTRTDDERLLRRRLDLVAAVDLPALARADESGREVPGTRLGPLRRLVDRVRRRR